MGVPAKMFLQRNNVAISSQSTHRIFDYLGDAMQRMGGSLKS
jgi:hypothetical protein